MQRDENTEEVVVKWLRFAKSDLAYALLPLPADGFTNKLVFMPSNQPLRTSS